MKVSGAFLALVAVVSAAAVPLDAPHLNSDIDTSLPEFELAKRLLPPKDASLFKGLGEVDTNTSKLKKRGNWIFHMCEHANMVGSCYSVERNDARPSCSMF